MHIGNSGLRVRLLFDHDYPGYNSVISVTDLRGVDIHHCTRGRNQAVAIDRGPPRPRERKMEPWVQRELKSEFATRFPLREDRGSGSGRVRISIILSLDVSTT